jgi:hypothetical protein
MYAVGRGALARTARVVQAERGTFDELGVVVEQAFRESGTRKIVQQRQCDGVIDGHGETSSHWSHPVRCPDYR